MNLFLSGLKSCWSRIFGRPEDPVHPDEPLTRYIFQKNQFKRDKNEVTAAAFLPDRSGETSVFRTRQLTDTRIWDIGVAHVEASRKEKNPKISLKARGDILAKVAFEQKLDVIPEVSLHSCHANLSNWPTDDSAQNLVAVELARQATLVPRPGSA